jgi:OPC-8:0 CoA ligase-1
MANPLKCPTLAAEQKRPLTDQKSGYCRDNGTYYSKRDPVDLPPPTQHLDVTTYIFSHHHHTQQTAFIDASSGLSLSYPTLRHNIRALAAGLQGLGIRKGEVVLVISPNSIALPCIYLAILSIGAILTTANPISTEAEIKRQAEDSKPVIIFTPANLINKVHATQLPVILIDGNTEDGSGSGCISTLNLLLQSAISGLPSVDIKQEDTATLLYSSGTTGKSKGVISTHRNFIAMIAGVLSRDDVKGGEKIYLCLVPLFHIFGFFYTVSRIAAGSTMVVMPKFDLVEMISAIQLYRVNTLPAPPPILVALSKSPIVAEYDLASLHTIACGGAPLGKDVIDNFTARFPTVQVQQGYGLTESSGSISFTNTDEENRHYGTAGLLAANVEAKVVDTTSGKAMPPNHKGELWLRGPTIMKGYFGNDEATASTFDSEGWLKTGDLCYIDEEGFLFVVDRVKELIKYKAFQVAPAELEELLLSNSEISDAAVIPYPDDEAGQIPMAFIVRKSDSNLSEENVKDFVANQVSPYKKIRRVAFVNSIPKSPSGKILRKDLIHQAVSTSRL